MHQLKNGLRDAGKPYDYSTHPMSSLISSMAANTRRSLLSSGSRRGTKNIKIENGVPYNQTDYIGKLTSKNSALLNSSLQLRAQDIASSSLVSASPLRKRKPALTGENLSTSTLNGSLHALGYNSSYSPYSLNYAAAGDYSGVANTDPSTKMYSSYSLASSGSYNPYHEYIMTSSSPSIIPSAYQTTSNCFNSRIASSYLGVTTPYYSSLTAATPGGSLLNRGAAEYSYSGHSGGLPSPEMSPPFDTSSIYQQQDAYRSAMDSSGLEAQQQGDLHYPTNATLTENLNSPRYDELNYPFLTTPLQDQQFFNPTAAQSSTYTTTSSNINRALYNSGLHYARNSVYYSSQAPGYDLVESSGAGSQATSETPDSLPQQSPTNYSTDWKHRAISDLPYSSRDAPPPLKSTALVNGMTNETSFTRLPSSLDYVMQSHAKSEPPILLRNGNVGNYHAKEETHSKRLDADRMVALSATNNDQYSGSFESYSPNQGQQTYSAGTETQYQTKNTNESSTYQRDDIDHYFYTNNAMTSVSDDVISTSQ